MVEPVSIVSGTVSILNGTFTFGQWMYRISGVSAEVRKAVTDLANIQNDLNEARQLRNLKFDMSSPEKKRNRLYRQLDTAIKQLEATVKECAKALHNPDVDFETRGSVTMAHRFEWVLNGKDIFASRQTSLMIDHNRLMKAVGVVNALPDISSSSRELLAPPPPYSSITRSGDHWDSFLSPSQRRAKRGKSTELIEEENGEREPITPQNSAPEPDPYCSSNTPISRKMRKLWAEDDSALQSSNYVETNESNVEDEYVASRHHNHKKRHRR